MDRSIGKTVLSLWTSHHVHFGGPTSGLANDFHSFLQYNQTEHYIGFYIMYI